MATEIEVRGRATVTVTIAANSNQEAVAIFHKCHPTFKAFEVDGLDIVGYCEGCRKLLLEVDDYVSDEDYYLCNGCLKRLIDSSKDKKEAGYDGQTV